MIKYLGSKRTLLPDLVAALARFPEHRSVVDLFSGTSRVGHALKRAGYRVLANDHNAYAHALARCYVAADRERVERDARRLIAELSALPGRAGYFTRTFCVEARFFQPKNGERIDAIRDEIAKKGLDPQLEAVLLVSLMEAADRVDSTCGVQMAYLKQWAPRAFKDLELRMPDVLPAAPGGPCEAHCLDAVDAVERLEADVFYVDPPYNQHSYLSNYHVWESLVRWDAPSSYGVARKREDCRTRKSAFNQRPEHLDAFTRVIEGARAALLIVSFNDEGWLSRETIEQVLARRGEVHVLARDFKRYVGAQIGIYSPQGQKVGKVGKLRNQELIFVVRTERATRGEPLARLLAELGDAARPGPMESSAGERA
jgi:adenine-specific DNA-methyltransferase